ncbi:YIP1 family protein [Patescibacteria group bacterium]
MDSHHKKHDDMQDELKTHFNDAVDTFKGMNNPGKFDLKKEVENAWAIIKLDTKKMHDVSMRKTTATAALLFFILAAIGSSLGMYLPWIRFGFPLGSVLISALVTFVGYVVMVFVYDFVASQFFKGKGKYGELFRVLGYGSLIIVASIIPVVGGLVGLWYLVISYKALATVKKMNPTHTVFTIIISILVIGVLMWVLNMIFGFWPSYMFESGLYGF